MFYNLRANATRKQRALLRDLCILCGQGIPNRATETHWAGMTKTDAATEIAAWYRQLGRFDAYEGPEDGDPEYDALSDKAKAFVWEGADPYAIAERSHA